MVTRLALALWLALAACGPAGYTLYVRNSWAESYGFACECGERRFQVLARGTGRVWMVCIRCGRGWQVTSAAL